MWSSRWNANWQGKPSPEPLCPPQVPYYLTWARTRAAEVGSRRPTAWADMVFAFTCIVRVSTTKWRAAASTSMFFLSLALWSSWWLTCTKIWKHGYSSIGERLFHFV
jgi:hypothetical protein